eukprot:CAMPEP_0177579028 /NCGR_PEP_ID=MMETSP0419_2-20121207/709_1 /TAXON_ID=582737 /ORGANISM="Tetraselmis sp., Strain GSL018" /LENGTH=220 /DNA_ID=CAMNT_0019067603 /DNA_START=520 /DNA_END=1182 /DNA_ORIENTATION=+
MSGFYAWEDPFRRAEFCYRDKSERSLFRPEYGQQEIPITTPTWLSERENHYVPVQYLDISPFYPLHLAQPQQRYACISGKLEEYLERRDASVDLGQLHLDYIWRKHLNVSAYPGVAYTSDRWKLSDTRFRAAKANTETFEQYTREMDLRNVSGFYSNSSLSKKRKLCEVKAKICSNCKTKETPFWRTESVTGKPLCNACGLYYRKNVIPRPARLWKSKSP